METVAIIGNGPSVLDKEMGEIIDRHDIVVRFNCFQTDGFENHIGIKTTIWVVNLAHDTWLVLNEHKEFRDFESFTVVETPNVKYKIRFKNVTNFISTVYKKPYDVYHKSFYGRVGRNIGGKKIPSTGMMAVWRYLDVYKHISLYGFNILTDVSPTHYYGGSSNIRSAHSTDAEAQFINKKIEEGSITLL